MKLFVYGLPRSGTTILQKGIAKALGLVDFGEDDGPLLPVDGYVAKQTAKYPWGTGNHLSGLADRTIITQRDDLINCCLSLHFVIHTKKFHYNKTDASKFDTQITVPIDHVVYWKENILTPYLEFVASHPDAIVINYSDIVKNNVWVFGDRINLDIVPLRPSNIDYAALCTNYKEIEELFND